MTTIEPLCHLIGVNSNKFSKSEKNLIEANFFLRVCEELEETFMQQHKDFFQIIKCDMNKEEEMLEKNFIRLILIDILSTKEYTLEGIAYYTNTPPDIIQELACGLNTKPSAICLRKVIELHRSVRKDLYQMISKKIAAEYLGHLI